MLNSKSLIINAGFKNQGYAVPTLLIIEQDTQTRKKLAQVAQRMGYSAISSPTPDEAKIKIERCSPAVILASKELIYAHHVELFALTDQRLSIWLVFSSSWPTTIRAEFQAYGCHTLYLDVDVISQQLDSLLTEPDALPKSESALDHLCGDSAAMQHLKQQIQKVAHTSLSVLLIGESGTGKELIAKAVHELSPRFNKPYVAVNCGAIPETLVESALFGHEKGSFTGADQQHAGVFEQTQDGTLFLDEITEMEAALQVRLLRVLENGEFYRVGGAEKLHAKARVVAATNVKPEHALAERKLRLDLYYRLAVLPLYVPSLHERRDDIPLLVDHFLMQLGTEFGEAKTPTTEALDYLQNKPWPGNVRQLKNELSRAYVLSDGCKIDEPSFHLLSTPNLDHFA